MHKPALVMSMVCCTVLYTCALVVHPWVPIMDDYGDLFDFEFVIEELALLQ